MRREACPSWAAEPACRRMCERGAGAAGLGTRVGPDERARRAARRGCGGLGPKMARQLRSGALSESTYRAIVTGRAISHMHRNAPYLAYPAHVYCVCLGESSGAVSGKFRKISAPAAPLANFSLNFAKLLPTPSRRSPRNRHYCIGAFGSRAKPCGERPPRPAAGRITIN